MNLIDVIRAHRGTLVILAIGVAGFGFLAHQDRTARHAAGIDDTCAWFQMVNQQFPMNRCFSMDEFFDIVGGRSRPNGGREDPTDEDRQKRMCEAMAARRESTPDQRLSGPDYVFSLLTRCAPGEPGNDAGEKP